jgi:hypothetical protein
MKTLAGILLLSTQILTIPAMATPKPEEQVVVHRYYDPDHRDYHEWNEAEARAYRHWLMEERREHRYREYRRLRAEQQREYWRWRHEHGDWH